MVYHGKRGIAFENFVRDFGAALAGMGDDMTPPCVLRGLNRYLIVLSGMFQAAGFRVGSDGLLGLRSFIAQDAPHMNLDNLKKAISGIHNHCKRQAQAGPGQRGAAADQWRGGRR